VTDNVSTHQAEDDARNEQILIWVNGRVVPKAEAMVSVYDSGFMLGDGVWEGIRLYNNRWTFLDEHIDRLFEAAKAIDLDIGRTKDEVIAAVLETQAANGMTSDAHARLMVTRGIKTRPFQHPKLSQQGPTMVIDPACHRAPSARVADDAGPEAEQPFQAELHPCLHRRRKGWRG